MSGDLSELYQQVILDHNRRPRNRGKLPTANRVAHGNNPSCGDECSVHLRLEGDRIADISFDGSGCAISQAGTSLITDELRGKRIDEILALGSPFVMELLGVEVGPTRIHCALLGLETAQKAIASLSSK